MARGSAHDSATGMFRWRCAIRQYYLAAALRREPTLTLPPKPAGMSMVSPVDGYGTLDALDRMDAGDRDLLATAMSSSFLAVGVLASLQAIETSLGGPSDSEPSFVYLTDSALAEDPLDESTAQRRHAGRKLRNGFSHPNKQPAWTFAMAANSKV